MRTPFQYLAVFQEQHLVGVADHAQTMGDDNADAAPHQPVQHRLYLPFGTRVHAAGGLVQDEQARVGQNDAGDGQQLALSLTQARAPRSARIVW
jgi:hypothetical protein